MKKVVALLATVVVSMVAVAGTASASPDAGEVVLSGFPCVVFDGNGDLRVTRHSTLTLYANQQTVKVVMRCEKYGAGAPSLTYYNYANTGGLCGFPLLGYTTDWSNKVGYRGHSQLTCTWTLYDNVPDFSTEGAASGTAGIG